MPKRTYPRWQRRHDAVLRWLLQNPARTLNECAGATGYSPSQISRIVNSPDFRTRYRAANELVAEELTKSVIRRLRGEET